MQYTINYRVKGHLSMDAISDYIDNKIVEKYATKDDEYGYELEIDSISNHDFSNFLEHLLRSDHRTREIIESHMQELIDQRLLSKGLLEREKYGISLVTTSDGDYEFKQTGEYYDE